MLWTVNQRRYHHSMQLRWELSYSSFTDICIPSLSTCNTVAWADALTLLNNITYHKYHLHVCLANNKKRECTAALLQLLLHLEAFFLFGLFYFSLKKVSKWGTETQKWLRCSWRTSVHVNVGAAVVYNVEPQTPVPYAMNRRRVCVGILSPIPTLAASCGLQAVHGCSEDSKTTDMHCALQTK